MKAKLMDISALPMDRMELTLLPPGELDVVIRLRCDVEAYARLLNFFSEAGFESPVSRKSAPEPKQLPVSRKVLAKKRAR